MLLKNKKKVNANVVQKEVERELSEDSLGQVAGGAMAKIESIPESPQGLVWEQYHRQLVAEGKVPDLKKLFFSDIK